MPPITRRALLKILALLPVVGPAITKALGAQALSPRRVKGIYLPADFPKWDPAVDGLEDVGKWLLALERSRLPKDLVFPRAGQVWEAIRDCEVSFHADICWQKQAGLGLPTAAAPLSPAYLKAFMGFGVATLRMGERVRILLVDDPKPVNVSFQPLSYQHLQEHIVPEEVRKLPGYHGYTLQLKTAKTVGDLVNREGQTYFTEAFRLVQEAGG